MNRQHGIVAGHRARKRFGQNFLVDESVIARIVAAIAPHADDRMIEIGPGLGALTCELIRPLTQLTVVELDRDVVPRLRARCLASGYGPERLTILEQDALSLDLAKLIEPDTVPERPLLRLAGNLPYNIATPLVFHLLAQKVIAGERTPVPLIRDMTFMMQKEVVDRIGAVPGNRNYGRLSIMVQAQADVEILFTVGPEAFNPPPKVDSAIVRLTPLRSPRVPPAYWPVFAELVTLAFAQRRKTLNNNLKQRLQTSKIKEAGLDPSQRAETVTLEQFIELTRLALEA